MTPPPRARLLPDDRRFIHGHVAVGNSDDTSNTLPLSVTDNRFGLYYPLRRMETESESAS